MLRFNPSKLIELRKKHRYSQAALAKILGLNKATIWHYENGTRAPGADDLCRIAAVLETRNLNQFFEWVESDKIPEPDTEGTECLDISTPTEITDTAALSKESPPPQ